MVLSVAHKTEAALALLERLAGGGMPGCWSRADDQAGGAICVLGVPGKMNVTPASPSLPAVYLTTMVFSPAVKPTANPGAYNVLSASCTPSLASKDHGKVHGITSFHLHGIFHGLFHRGSWLLGRKTMEIPMVFLVRQNLFHGVSHGL